MEGKEEVMSTTARQPSRGDSFYSTLELVTSRTNDANRITMPSIKQATKH